VDKLCHPVSTEISTILFTSHLQAIHLYLWCKLWIARTAYIQCAICMIENRFFATNSSIQLIFNNFITYGLEWKGINNTSFRFVYGIYRNKWNVIVVFWITFIRKMKWWIEKSNYLWQDIAYLESESIINLIWVVTHIKYVWKYNVNQP
jgi:hypothetical protein